MVFMFQDTIVIKILFIFTVTTVLVSESVATILKKSFMCIILYEYAVIRFW